MGRSKKEIFGVWRERIWARINGWGEKNAFWCRSGGHDKSGASSYTVLHHELFSTTKECCSHAGECYLKVLVE